MSPPVPGPGRRRAARPQLHLIAVVPRRPDVWAAVGSDNFNTNHIEGALPARHRWFTAPVYRSFVDPDGRAMGCDCGEPTDSTPRVP